MMWSSALEADQRSDPMRIFAIACLVSLVGCIIIAGSDPVRVDRLTADTAETFTYSVQTNTVMTANDDGEAEQIRRGWLAEELAARGMCSAGYVIETRRLEPTDIPSSNALDVVYTGRCLLASSS
jgi:hypothetical protein